MAIKLSVRCPKCAFKGKYVGSDDDNAFFFCVNPDCGALLSFPFRDELEDLDQELLPFGGDGSDGEKEEA